VCFPDALHLLLIPAPHGGVLPRDVGRQREPDDEPAAVVYLLPLVHAQQGRLPANVAGTLPATEGGLMDGNWLSGEIRCYGRGRVWVQTPSYGSYMACKKANPPDGCKDCKKAAK
jgi:hypothetical protein